MSARILLGFGESLPAPEAFFSLRRAGHAVSLFYRKGTRRPLFDLAVSCHPVTAPEKSTDQARRDIEAVLRANEFDAFYAIDDTALWLANQVEIFGAAPVHATGPQAEAALDKRIQLDAAERAGLSVPPGSRDCIAEDGLLPVIVKPALAVTEIHGRLVKGASRYVTKATSGEMQRLEDDVPAIVQSLIAGQGEGVFGFATEGGITGWSGHRRLRMLNPHGSGSSACISAVPAPDLRKKVAAMMSALNWRGPFMVELLRDGNGTAWFMELNGRLWGSLALARRLGMDHPAWAVAQTFDPGFVPTCLEAREGVEMRHLGRELLHPLFVLRGPQSDFHRADWPAIWPAVRGAWAPGKAEGFYNYDPQSPFFFLRDALFDVGKQVFG